MSDNGRDYNTRLTRIEGLLEVITVHQMEFVDDHRKLLTAQVLLTDSMAKLTEAQRHTDERLNALIGMVDGRINKGGLAGPDRP